MTTYSDAQNIIADLGSEPDKLRAEIGKYLGEDGFPSDCSNGYLSFAVEEPTAVDETVFSRKKYSCVISASNDGFFRDLTQWSEYLRRTILLDENFFDHRFSYNVADDSITNTFVNNFHMKNYEDQTKELATKLLANYNLLSYNKRDDVEEVNNISQMITPYDNNHSVDPSSIDVFLSSYLNRTQNYIGSLETARKKQSNLFFIDNELNTININRFPFYYKSEISTANNVIERDLLNLLSDTKKEKSIFQALKNNVGVSYSSFSSTDSSLSRERKIYDLITILSSTDIASFSIGSDELFLMSEDKLIPNDQSNFFADQIQALNCFGEIRTLIKNNQRSFQEIIGAGVPLQECEKFEMGFKVEKYINNTTQNPIQTYYFKDLEEFFDTQMKYGVRYFYKIKRLVAVLGASYKYSNLYYKNEELKFVNFDGEENTSPMPQAVASGSDYVAQLEVEVLPSFQIFEILLSETEQTFLDLPSHPPIVQPFVQKNKGTLEFYLRPSGYEGPIESEYVDDIVTAEYSYGTYRIYRLSMPPDSIEQMESGYIAEVDEKMNIVYPQAQSRVSETVDKETAFFEDKVVPNKKYYYSFKSVSYHGTESSFSPIYEVEMLRDSDEYKAEFKEFKISQSKDYVMNRGAKRLLRVVPNLQRLIFTDEYDGNSFKLGNQDGEQLFSSGTTRTFKIRLTSKHTGKKIDFNINFKIVETAP